MLVRAAQAARECPQGRQETMAGSSALVAACAAYGIKLGGQISISHSHRNTTILPLPGLYCVLPCYLLGRLMSAWLLICGDAAGDADNSSPLRHTQP